MNFDSNRTYGIEIEMSWGRDHHAPSRDAVAAALRRAGLNASNAGYSHNVSNGWKVVSDGSVRNGHELVSPILRGLDGKEQLKTAMRAVKAIGAVTDASCGVHVHHGVHDFTAKQLANIAEIYANNEPTIDKLVASSRRNTHWAMSMTGRQYFDRAITTLNGEWQTSHHDINAKANLTRELAPNGRYFKVNFHAFPRQGTVEFRQHQSSLNAVRIWNWVVFTQLIVSAAKAKRGKANPVTVNTGNPETAGERGLIRDLNMRKRIDPRSGRQNYDDVAMSALRGMAVKRGEGRFAIGLDINLRAGAVEVEVEGAMTAEERHSTICNGHMVERTNRNTGETFLGCSNYRQGCRFSTNTVAA